MNNTLPSDEQLTTHQELDAERYNILTSCYPDISLLGMPLGTCVGSLTSTPISIVAEPTYYTKDKVDELLTGITSELQKLKEEISELKGLSQNKRYFAEKELIEKLLNDSTLLG